jgi:hypothetical protein
VINHVHDDEEMVLVGLDFGPLAHVQHVLESQRMQAVFRSQAVEDLNIPEAIDIEPAHFAVVVRAVRQIVEIFDDAFRQGVRVVFDELDDWRLGPEFNGQRLQDRRTRTGNRMMGPEHALRI